MLPAIGIDNLDRLGSSRHQLGHPGVVARRLGADLGLEVFVLLQRRADRVCRNAGARINRRGIELVMPVADIDQRLLLRHIKMVRAFLQLFPEGDIGVGAVLGQIFSGHAEGIGLHLDGALATGKAFPRNGVDFGDLLVRHRETAGRRTGAVHHDRAAAMLVHAVIGIGIADVERQIIAGIGVHLAGRDRVETLRHLAVALAALGAKLAGPAAHREGFEQRVAPVRLHLPDFKLGFFLVSADEDGRGPGRPGLFHQRQRVRRDWLMRAGDAAIAVLTPRKQCAQGCCDKRFYHQSCKRSSKLHPLMSFAVARQPVRRGP